VPASLLLGLIASKPYTSVNSFPRPSSRLRKTVCSTDFGRCCRYLGTRRYQHRLALTFPSKQHPTHRHVTHVVVITVIDTVGHDTLLIYPSCHLLLFMLLFPLSIVSSICCNINSSAVYDTLCLIAAGQHDALAVVHSCSCESFMVWKG